MSNRKISSNATKQTEEVVRTMNWVRCQKHGNQYPKGGFCPKCKAENK